jgi:predicted amidohydrolase YtcJ
MEARQLVEKFIPGTTEAQAVDGLEQISDYALSVGCTGVHDAGLEGHEIRAYQTALEQGKLKIRAYLLWSSELVESMEFLGLRTGFGNEMVRLGSAKMLIDGSIGARTAALFEPYEDDPSTKGLLRISMEELVEKIKAVHNQGSQVAVHAIGDYAVELAMNAIEEALKGSPRKDHRHRIEHCELLSSSQIERIKQLGIVASMQPNFVGNWSHPEGLYDTRLGKKRLRQNNPYRILLDEDITVAFGSDCMPFNPLYGIWSAVNHPIRMHRISLEEAVRSYTLDVAYTSFEEEIKGSIEPGKLADITVVEEDLTKIDSDDLKEATIQMTILNGKILYHKK